MSSSSGKGSRLLLELGFATLLLVLGVDFHFDVRERDLFSWMDPYQYFDFALGVLDGREHFTRFEIPSIFPFFLMPALAVSPSVPAALWTNFAFTAVLLLVVRGLCRELGLATPVALVAWLVVSSPLLLGLSRCAYVEYALSAVVAGTLLLWMRYRRRRDAGSRTLFACSVAVGLLLKMTFPLFLVLPVGVAVAERLWARDARTALQMLAATLFPIAAVLSLQAAVFPTSFAYYTSLGNTLLPIMRLIGPPEWLSWSSAFYYLGEIGRSLLGLLAPFLAVAALAALPGLTRLRFSDAVTPTATLWLWLIGPLVLLVLEPVKEPRHVAPCVVPAVLLVVAWIESVAGRWRRHALVAAAVAAAVVQYAGVASGRLAAPYFLDRSLHWAEVANAMLGSSARSRYRSTPPADRLIHWKFDQNVALAGFPPNEALALTWQMFPGIVFDLATLSEPARQSDEIPFARFEDLYILTAFNTYNRRTGWRHYYATLPQAEVIDNADFVLLNDADGGDPASRFPTHTLVSSIPVTGGSIHVLQSRSRDTIPYRVLYARAFLERNPALSEDERSVVLFELLRAAALDTGAPPSASPGASRDPGRSRPARNIYWIAGYEVIDRLTRMRVSAGSPR